MIRLFYGVMCFFVLAVAVFAPVQAQDYKPTDYRQPHLATPEYNGLVNLLLTKPQRYDFMKLRSLYSRSHQYDPIGNRTLKDLNDLAYIAITDKDQERVKTALFGYNTIVKDHIAHIDIVLQALILAREDKRFGDPEFLEWVKEGLINTIIISGDGRTLQGAYDVITLSEETILFNRLGMKQLESKAVKEGAIYYNMHDVRQVDTNEKRSIFINTTIPMKYMEALAEERGTSYSFTIPRQ